MRKKICLLLCVLMAITLLSGCTKVIVFEDYQGPNFPLSVLPDAEGIVVERNVECDYSDYDYSQNSTRIVHITDQYILKNTTDEDIVIETVYPFAGHYGTLAKMIPGMKVDGEKINTDLVIGRNTERYKTKLEAAGVENANDVYTLHNLECFELLLQDGAYQKEALDAVNNVPEFTEKVTVYEFEDVGYSGYDENMLDPSATISFTFDPEKSDIYCYGMNSQGKKDEVTSLGFRVPKRENHDYGKSVYVIVAGEELEVQDVKCYHHPMANSETDAFSLDYVKYESTMEEILWKIVSLNKNEHDLWRENESQLYTTLLAEQVFNAGKQNIADLDEVDHNGVEIFPLESYMFEFFGDFRVFYKTAEVEVPAHGSIELEVSYDKFAGIKNIEKENYDGLEILTGLDSNLKTERQTLKVVGAENLTFSEHTTGDELENGQYKVEMQDECFEIYVVVPERELEEMGARYKGW